MSFTPHEELRNNVTPNVQFVNHMYTSLSSGLSSISVSSLSAATVYSVLLNAYPVKIKMYSLSANDNVLPTNSVSGYYGNYLNNEYKNVNFIAKKTSSSAQDIQNEFGYFEWTSHIFDSVQDALSGVAHFSSPSQLNIINATSADILSNANYIVITACVWNIDDNSSIYGYNISNSDIILYTNDPTNGIQQHTMSYSIDNPIGAFNLKNHFYKIFNGNDFPKNQKTYYWIKTIETWKAKQNYSLTGYFNRGGSEWDYSATALTGDTTGNTREESITSYHSAIAFSCNGLLSTGGSDWQWKNIFSKVWN